MTTAMYDQVKAAGDGAMMALDHQLDRLDNSLERLARALMPVTRHEPTGTDVRPEEYAPTAIRERIIRLSSRLDNLDGLMNSIDL